MKVETPLFVPLAPLARLAVKVSLARRSGFDLLTAYDDFALRDGSVVRASRTYRPSLADALQHFNKKSA
ncbi:hypothetical protein [Massilia oculi]|uniref:hypothetical protein n=1 Tax=Massilia oculi TaxID=945844 RepID=UPI0028A7F82A|nr:hypothetical protein [Massilia oculi]